GVSVKAHSTNGVGIVGERPMYFIHDFGNGSINGAHDVLGAGTGDTSWFFAEGTLRNGFFEFITLQNPNDNPARARLDYFVQDRGVVTNFRDLPPNSRSTIVAFDRNSEGSLAQALGIQAPAVVGFGLRATSVDANGAPDNANEVVVERPMYVNTPIADSPVAINDGHDTLGFQFPAGQLPCLPGQSNCVQPGPSPSPTPTPTPAVADLSITKPDSPDPASTGQDVTYTISVTNNGPDTAVGVVVTDTLPAGATVVSIPAECTQSGSTLTCPVDSPNGEMQSGGTATFLVTVSFASAGDYTDNASVSSNTSDNNLANNSASATTTVTPPADLEMLTKTASSATVTVPSQITYTLIGRNNGP